LAYYCIIIKYEKEIAKRLINQPINNRNLKLNNNPLRIYQFNCLTMRNLQLTALVLFLAQFAFAQTCTHPRPSAGSRLVNNDICIGQPMSIENLTETNGNNVYYIWNWGDGTTPDTLLDKSSPIHIYERPNSDKCSQPKGGFEYPIQLFVINLDSSCENHDITTKAYAYFTPEADFDAPSEVCADNPEVAFVNKTCPLNTKGTTIEWDFGDPKSGVDNKSTDKDPIHKFSGKGVYTVTLKVDSKCKSTEKKMTIVVHDAPVALGGFTLPSVSTVCAPYEMQVSNTSSGSKGSSWSVSPTTGWSFAQGTDATSDNPILRFDTNGEFTVSLQIRTACGTRDWTSAQKIIVKSKPQVSMDTLIGSCLPFQMTPVGKVDNDGGLSNQYKWTIAGGSIPSSTNLSPGSITFAIKGTFPIKFRAENTCGADSVTRFLPVTDKITVFFPTVSDTLCSASQAVQLTAFPSGGVWTGTGITPAGSFDPSVTGVGTYAVNYKVSFGSCSDNKDKTINVFGTDVKAGPLQEACANASKNATLTGGFPVGGTWSGTGVTSPSGIFTPSVAGAGTYNLTYTYLEPKAKCPNTATKIFIVNEPPTAIIDTLKPMCLGEFRDFKHNSLGAATYAWSFGDNTTSPNEIPAHTYAKEGVYDVRLMVADVKGCMDTADSKIIVSAPPTAAYLQSTIEGCTPLNVTFTNNSTGTNAKHTWDFGNGRTLNSTNPGTITFDNRAARDTQYMIRLAVVTPGCPVAYDSSKIIVFNKPKANFVYDIGEGCSPLEVKFFNASTGSPRFYAWNFGNGGSSNAEQPSIQKYYTDTIVKKYTISLVATNFCGVDTTTRTVTVTPPSVKAFFGLDKIEGCSPLTVAVLGAPTYGAATQYTLGDGAVSNDISMTHTFTEAGTYKIRQMVSGLCGQDSMERTVTVWATPSVDFTYSQFNICKDRNVQFKQTTSPNVSVNWDLGDGTKIGAHNPLHDYKRSGDFMVKLDVSDLAHGCKNNDSMLIQVRSPLKFGFDSIRHSACYGINTGAIVIQRGDVSGGLPTYQFALNDSNFKDVSLSGIFSNLEGRRSHTVWVRDRAGCVDSASTYIKGFPTLNLDAGRDREIDLGDSTHTFVTTNAYKLLDLKWTPSHSVSCDTCQEVYLQPVETTTYTVRATGPEGCTEKTNITVRVSSTRKIFVPNVFSPNDDGNNDFFFPQSGKNIKEITYFRIFNRWGELIFENKNFQPNSLNEGWNGNYKGEKMGDDVFIWSMEVELRNGIKELYKGDVTLMR
jgi:gliding motility-associated-like protein